MKNKPAMRAKIQIGCIIENKNEDGSLNNEQFSFHGVCASNYPEDGSDEDNTFARFSPAIALNMNVANPALFGKFKQGQKFYIDFIPVEE